MHAKADMERYEHVVDPGLAGLCGVSAYFRIPTSIEELRRELSLAKLADYPDLMRAAKTIGLRARWVKKLTKERLAKLPAPCLIKLKTSGFRVFGGVTPDQTYRVVDPVTRTPCDVSLDELFSAIEPQAILLARKAGGPGVSPRAFSMRWFLPTIWRYRRPLSHVLLASMFVQMFALLSPVFFQVIIDKVLGHKSYDTLLVLVLALAVIGFFDVFLQYLRTYALSHTSNRIDVELGCRLFAHLFQLPLSYFETRAAGQTVARVRELETIRSFLTGQGLFSVIDLFFAFVFIAVLIAYSWKLALIVVFSIPLYAVIAAFLRPPLREKIEEKFNRGAESQQMLVEAVVGAQTIKAFAIEPAMRIQWEEKLAAYVRASFDATLLQAGGQSAIQYISKLTTAALLLFGAKAVIDGDLSVGEFVAFNMIAGQVWQPVLRLSQIWQDLQQIQISVERLGDILNASPECQSDPVGGLPPIQGEIALSKVSFSYRPDAPDVLRDVSMVIRPGEVVGIYGPSGSGKSTLAKLIQNFYTPREGQVLIDGSDVRHVPPAWLRTQIGVVLQDTLLFNRSIRDNIAIANPTMSAAQVIVVARLSGAHEFIAKLPKGYDTVIEERGVNLSGGQRQRIAIARALATNPPVLILDEATSALDYESERLVQQNMREIIKGRTVIIIAHRLQTLRILLAPRRSAKRPDRRGRDARQASELQRSLCIAVGHAAP